jgi:hypothetical protein
VGASQQWQQSFMSILWLPMSKGDCLFLALTHALGANFSTVEVMD